MSENSNGVFVARTEGDVFIRVLGRGTFSKRATPATIREGVDGTGVQILQITILGKCRGDTFRLLPD